MKKVLQTFVFSIVIAFGSTGLVLAQEEKSAQNVSKEEIIDAKPEAPEKVDVKPVARDGEIERRLNEILNATKRFEQSTAKVENGVVFLTGIAKEDAFKAWASDLAKSTQDVAAVVNQMDVAEKSIWDFSDAFATLRKFRNETVQAIPLIIFGIIVFVLTWLLAKLAGHVADRGLGKKVPNSLLRWVATRAVMLPILIFGIYLILRVSGLTQLALTVLGGTGLIGLIIGIAFQDIAENFLASILISVQKPFRVGDLILVDGHQGIVQRVTTRGTTLLTADGNHVQIPNSKVYQTTIENFTANPQRRVSFDIGIGYDDSTSEAQQIVLDKLKQHSATINDPPPRVLIESLGASTVNLRALFWIDGTANDWHSVRSSCMRISKQALLQAGISLPDEAREVIFPNGVPVSMNDVHQENNSVESSGQKSSKPSGDMHIKEVASDANKVRKKPQVNEQDASEAEGHMQSDIDDLRRQGEQSWLPGEGEEVLIGNN